MEFFLVTLKKNSSAVYLRYIFFDSAYTSHWYTSSKLSSFISSKIFSSLRLYKLNNDNGCVVERESHQIYILYDNTYQIMSFFIPFTLSFRIFNETDFQFVILSEDVLYGDVKSSKHNYLAPKAIFLIRNFPIVKFKTKRNTRKTSYCIINK